MKIGVWVLVAGLVGSSQAAFAQTFPTKPISWIVPFTPGGVTDTTSRAVAKRMGELLGVSIVVENRPGAGGMLGTELAARAAPDGYTVLYCTQGTMAANIALYKNVRYDPVKDFTPVHGMFSSSTVMVVPAGSPHKTFAEFLEYGRKNPSKLNMGSAGAGTGTHLIGELLQLQGGFKMTHIPYKGSVPALGDLVGGRTDVMFDYPVAILPHIQSGKLRPLAIMGPKRLAIFPDVPSIAELGFPEAAAAPWSALCVPSATPPEVVRKLGDAMRDALADPAVVGQFERIGSTTQHGLRDDKLRAFIQAEIRRWADVVKRTGTSLD